MNDVDLFMTDHRILTLFFTIECVHRSPHHLDHHPDRHKKWTQVRHPLSWKITSAYFPNRKNCSSNRISALVIVHFSTRITYISIYMNFWPYHKRVPTIGNTRHFWNLITQKLLESVYSFISVFSRVVVVYSRVVVVVEGGGGASPVPFSWESIFRFRGRDTPMRGKVYDSTPVYLGTF